MWAIASMTMCCTPVRPECVRCSFAAVRGATSHARKDEAALADLRLDSLQALTALLIGTPIEDAESDERGGIQR